MLEQQPGGFEEAELTPAEVWEWVPIVQLDF
jgi:hypothetical protein